MESIITNLFFLIFVDKLSLLDTKKIIDNEMVQLNSKKKQKNYFF